MPCIEALTELHTLELVVSDYDSGSTAFKALSRSLPCLKQLETLCLGRDASEDAYDELHYDLEFADDYGDQALSEEDVLAIGRALKAWPLPLLNRVSGNHGADVDFGICRQELGLPTPFDQFWHITPNTSCDSLAFFRVQQKKVEVFARRIQKRLGALSLMSVLDEQALMMIVDQVLGGWSSWKQWQQQQPQQH